MSGVMHTVCRIDGYPGNRQYVTMPMHAALSKIPKHSASAATVQVYRRILVIWAFQVRRSESVRLFDDCAALPVRRPVNLFAEHELLDRYVPDSVGVPPRWCISSIRFRTDMSGRMFSRDLPEVAGAGPDLRQCPEMSANPGFF